MRWQPASREAAFESASDIPTPEECQMLRLHPKKGCETLHQRAVQHLTPHGSHQSICTRVKTGIPNCTLQVSAVFYLLFTYLANHLYGVWALASPLPPLFFFNYCHWQC